MSELTDNFGTASEKVRFIRKSVDQPIGMVIADILGDVRVKQLFDEAGKHPEEYAGMATGEAALKMGVITQNTKTALLVAQAAERTLLLARRMEEFFEQRDGFVKQLEDSSKGEKPRWEAQKECMNKIDEKIGPRLDVIDPVFKFVGSEKDTAVLKKAQGTWMAATLYLTHEIAAMHEQVCSPDFLGRPVSQGKEAVNGFRQAAAEFYAKAAELLEKGGHKDAAEKFALTSKSLKEAYPPEKDAPTPAGFMQSLYWSECRAVQDVNMMLNNDNCGIANEDIIKKVIQLTGLDMTHDVVRGLMQGTDEKLKVGRPLQFSPRTPLSTK